MLRRVWGVYLRYLDEYVEPNLVGAASVLARAKATVGFGANLVKALPLLVKYARTKDPVLRQKIGPSLGFGKNTAHLWLSDTPFSTGDQPAKAACKITIILPIYNAFELVQECLDRVEKHTDLPWRLIAVEDCSTDERVRPWLQNWVSEATARGCDVTLFENTPNRGFIGSVNRAFEHALTFEDHVVLLNSDALVPAGWASRLLQPIASNSQVATVTPMSNDAEIFTTPVICERHGIEPGVGDALDRVASTLERKTPLINAPTGVGFCMAMNGDFLAQIPSLDTVFGRGYGEEVDWCQKAQAFGGHHVACPFLFVEHRGGESFGSAEKLRLIQKNGAVISSRYPRYDRDVQTFIRTDPIISQRLALGIAYLGLQTEQSIPVYLAHSMGGGAEMWLRQQIKQDVESIGGAVVIRVGGPARWLVELTTAQGQVLGKTDSLEAVKTYLSSLSKKTVIYSCGAGDPEMISIPDALLKIIDEGDRLEVLIHDYLPVAPSHTLLTSDGTYLGVPADDSQDRAFQTQLLDGSPMGLQVWRERWGKLVARADRVRVFSQSSRTIVEGVYPNAKIDVTPHSLLIDVPTLDAPADDGVTTIGVLGSINLHKGAQVVVDAARRETRNGKVRFVVIGTLDPAVSRPASLKVHGPYDVAEIAGLAQKYALDGWLIPSIWPETFSYSTHEALATGLPVFAFDIGAQGDAVSAAPNGHVIQMNQNGDLAEAVVNAVLEA